MDLMLLEDEEKKEKEDLRTGEGGECGQVSGEHCQIELQLMDKVFSNLIVLEYIELLSDGNQSLQESSNKPSV